MVQLREQESQQRLPAGARRYVKANNPLLLVYKVMATDYERLVRLRANVCLARPNAASDGRPRRDSSKKDAGGRRVLAFSRIVWFDGKTTRPPRYI